MDYLRTRYRLKQQAIHAQNLSKKFPRSKQKNNGMKLHRGRQNNKLANGPMETIEKGPTSAPAHHNFNPTHESLQDQSQTKMGENREQ